MNEIKVEHDIPVPVTHCNKYPFDKMQVGDSFGIPCNDRTRAAVRNRVNVSCVLHRARTPGSKFKISSKRGTSEVRVWRTA
jgi:hypothetical protein